MIERENTPMTTSSDVIAGLELALASADAMIERLQGERAILRDSAKDVIAWCDANPPVGDALYCITRLRHAIAATESPNAEHHREHTGCLRVFVDEQAAEISRLRKVLAKCRDGIEGSLSDCLPYINKCKEALAAIKEEGL